MGEARAKAFEKLGVFTLGDLIAYYPRRWEDRSQLYPIRDLPEREYACCKAMIAQPPTTARIRGGQTLVQVRAVDEGGVLDVSFFHQEYRKNVLHPGETYIFYGKVEGGGVRRRMVNPLLETEGKQLLTGRIMPIYPLTAGLTQTMVAKAVRQGLDQCRDLPEDVLPDGIRQAHHLCYAGFAYENIHFPASEEALDTARRRLVFEELFLLSCGLSLLRQRRETVAGLPCQAADMASFYAALPFALTAAQRRAIADAVGDMTSGRPMNRLCQGDVGSGKTMVAAACVWFAAQSGWQSALMAPTEILARQHYENLAPLFARFGLPCALLTGSTPARERRAILAGLQSGDITLCIGTHALLTADVQYARLGLVITDEQHRFGVEQRSALSHKGAAPHTLVLSATPIPRTLALIIYGDLDVSVIDELPPGRQTVETFALAEPVTGEVTVRLAMEQDRCETGAPAASLPVVEQFNAGGLAAVLKPEAGAVELASAVRDGARRLLASVRTLENGSRLGFVRALTPCDPEVKPGRHLDLLPPSEAFPAERLMRLALAEFGWKLRFTGFEADTLLPRVNLSRHDNAFCWSVFAPDTTAEMRLNTPFGAPVPDEMETRLCGGDALWHPGKCMHRACRCFVRQRQDAVIGCKTMWAEYAGVKGRMQYAGFRDAEVRFFPPEGCEATLEVVNPPPEDRWNLLSEALLPVEWEDTPHGRCAVVRNVNGTLRFAW